MSDEGTKYYEREDVLFRDPESGPLEIYQGGWSPYTGDCFRVRHESSIVSAEDAAEMIKENDAHWREVSARRKAS